MAWQTRCQEKRAKCYEAIPQAWRISDSVRSQFQLSPPLENETADVIGSGIVRDCGILTADEIKITEDYSVKELLALLASGALSSVQVTTAFSKRAAIAQQLVNCLTETYFGEALERAKYLDELRMRGEPLGPLHGLPISIKDSFQVVGSQATLGIVSFLDKTSDTNSVLVNVLLKLGAVVYVKTNVPQTLATVDSENNIFGRTLNPWNTSLGPGGSSGGEGALVAMRGSPLGVGTDVGGSVRIPALCCGVYGFKPTVGRVPYGGQQGCGKPGLSYMTPAAGPLSNNVESLDIFTSAVLKAHPAALDSTAIDVPWRTVSSSPAERLRIGLVPEDATYPLHPPVKRAMAQAVKQLEAGGHTIIPLTSERCHVADATEVAWEIFLIDPTAYQLCEESGEPIVQSVKHTHTLARSIDHRFLGRMDGLDRLDRMSHVCAKRDEIAEDWRSNWVENDLDVVICPPAQSTAVEHDKFGLPPYTTLLNVLDYPACILPFGRISSSDMRETFESSPGQTAPGYHPEQLINAPCSVQIFTRSLHDEECLSMAKIVDSCLNG